MLRVQYTPNGGIVKADDEIDRFVLDTILWANMNSVLCCVDVGSGVIIDRFRLAICEGDIDCNNIVFEFNGEELQPDCKGRFPRWPRGFCDYSSKVLQRLLIAPRPAPTEHCVQPADLTRGLLIDFKEIE